MGQHITETASTIFYSEANFVTSFCFRSFADTDSARGDNTEPIGSASSERNSIHGRCLNRSATGSGWKTDFYHSVHSSCGHGDSFPTLNPSESHLGIYITKRERIHKAASSLFGLRRRVLLAGEAPGTSIDRRAKHTGEQNEM